MNDLLRKYHMPDSTLSMFAGYLIVLMKRDAALFAARGVSSDDIAAFENLTNNFKVLNQDSYYQATLYGDAEMKRYIRKKALAKLLFVSGFFEQMWGRYSSEYKLLRIKKINDMPDNDFLITCYNVATIASDYLPTLSAIGLSQSDIDALASDAREFEDKMNVIAYNKALRNQYTHQRVQLANELYSFVKQYCTVGKLIWYDVDPSKYDNYLIYRNARKSRPADAIIPSEEAAMV